MCLLFPETKGRTLEEMNAYFEQTHWIVPLAKDVPYVSTKQREEELRQGYLPSGGEVVKEGAHPADNFSRGGLAYGNESPQEKENSIEKM